MGNERSTGLILIDLEEVKAKLAVRSDSTVPKYIKERGFPAPVKGSRRFARWVLAEVDAWILERIKERDAAKERIAA